MRFRHVLSVMSLVILTPLLNAGFAQETHYVDSRMGNDAFDGSTFTLVSGLKGPFFSIRRAMAGATSGDTIAIRAGDYAREGQLEAADKDLTLLIFPNGKNHSVILEGLTLSHPDRILTLANSEQAANGRFVTNGDDDDLVLEAGTVHIAGGLAIGKGGTVKQTDGILSGNELITLDQ